MLASYMCSRFGSSFSWRSLLQDGILIYGVAASLQDGTSALLEVSMVYVITAHSGIYELMVYECMYVYMRVRAKV